MEELEEIRLSTKMSDSLAKTRYVEGELDQVTAHCRRDHLGATFHEHANASSYQCSYSPSKNMPNYNQPQVQKSLQKFRKNETSVGMLPTISKIQNYSQYHNSYQSHSMEKFTKGAEKDSFFLKMNWALDPSSNYQKDYPKKDGYNFNKQNVDRPDYSNLQVMHSQSGAKLTTNYRTEFKTNTIKKEAQLSLGARDHLASKQNCKTLVAISEYQRRYDSVIEKAKPKEGLVSIYRKQPIPRKLQKIE